MSNLAAKGFTPLTNPVMRSLMGKKISLENALLSKKLDVSASEKEMCALIENMIEIGRASCRERV